MKSITYFKGTLPIILTSLHNGKNIIKSKIREGTDIIIKNDLNTSIACLEISNYIFSKIKKKPYLLLNNIDRKYVDLNRKLNYNIKDKDISRIYWNRFHNKLTEIILDCKKKFGHCIIIDIHGNNKSSELVQIGYGCNLEQIFQKKYNKFTLKYLSDKYDANELIFGKRSLSFYLNLDNLPSYKYKTLNKINNRIGESSIYFNGGYLIRNYSKIYNLDAIQLELSRNLRKGNNIYDTSSRIAESIIKFYLINY